jgi:hypothetical protein
MKKLLILVSLVIISILSCEKERDQTRCWTCEKWTKEYFSGTVPGYPKTNYNVEAVCDFNEDGIRLYEIANSDTTRQNGGSYDYITETITKCK